MSTVSSCTCPIILIHILSIDVDFPTDCDDAYWVTVDPEQDFKQPPGQPSKVSFFISGLRLTFIESKAFNTIVCSTERSMSCLSNPRVHQYSANKSKASHGRAGPKGDEQAVADLDSALNSFIDTIPKHRKIISFWTLSRGSHLIAAVKWNPQEQNLLFFAQSAYLISQFYRLQINIHRAFIPSPGQPSRFSLPSLTICTNAARSCIHVLSDEFERMSQILGPDVVREVLY